MGGASNQECIIAYFDGLTEPRNPGGFSCGGFVTEPFGDYGFVLSGHRCFMRGGPESTNNRSEYEAALMALEAIWTAGHRGPVILRGDSQLVVKQFNGEFRCGAPLLVPLLERLRKAGEHFSSLTLEWIPRAENEAADELSRLAYREETGKEAPVRLKAAR